MKAAELAKVVSTKQSGYWLFYVLQLDRKHIEQKVLLVIRCCLISYHKTKQFKTPIPIISLCSWVELLF